MRNQPIQTRSAAPHIAVKVLGDRVRKTYHEGVDRPGIATEKFRREFDAYKRFEGLGTPFTPGLMAYDEDGLWLEIEGVADGHTVAYANKQARDRHLSTAFFPQGLMSPATARTLPKFDVILLLSAFHEIYEAFDEEDAYRLFGDLLKACGRKMIFESASTNNRYSRERTVLAKDNDRDAIEAWVRELASRSAGWRVRFVGETSYTNEEPHRYMFAIESAAESSPESPPTDTAP